jgi:hypothetical protein
LVENQTSEKIKVLHSDNGNELLNHDLWVYLKKCWIVNHITVPHTPQQKEVAERKNRTAFKNARSRLQDAGLGKKYWAEVVSTTTYVLKETFAHYIYEKHDPTRSLDRQEDIPNTCSSLQMQTFVFWLDDLVWNIS